MSRLDAGGRARLDASAAATRAAGKRTRATRPKPTRRAMRRSRMMKIQYIYIGASNRNCPLLLLIASMLGCPYVALLTRALHPQSRARAVPNHVAVPLRTADREERRCARATSAWHAAFLGETRIEVYVALCRYSMSPQPHWTFGWRAENLTCGIGCTAGGDAGRRGRNLCWEMVGSRCQCT
jgi:hypothetical protein